MLLVGGLRCGVVPRGDFWVPTNALTLDAGRDRALGRARPRAYVAAVVAGRYGLMGSSCNQRTTLARRFAACTGIAGGGANLRGRLVVAAGPRPAGHSTL